MNSEIEILAFSALSIGFLHTILGPDHYIPFIAMAKAGKWSKKKTIWVTTLSGFGHVVGSIILGLLGIALGVALNIVEEIEAPKLKIKKSKDVKKASSKIESIAPESCSKASEQMKAK